MTNQTLTDVETAKKIRGYAFWEDMAARYDLGKSRFRDGLTSAAIERVTQRDGSYLWAIRDHGLVLNKAGEWEYEPQPSSREDDFLERSRYATKEEAFALWEKFGTCDYPVKVP